MLPIARGLFSCRLALFFVKGKFRGVYLASIWALSRTSRDPLRGALCRRWEPIGETMLQLVRWWDTVWCSGCDSAVSVIIVNTYDSAVIVNHVILFQQVVTQATLTWRLAQIGQNNWKFIALMQIGKFFLYQPGLCNIPALTRFRRGILTHHAACMTRDAAPLRHYEIAPEPFCLTPSS